MKINIFKGARRIAILCAVLLTVGTLINSVGSYQPGLARYSIAQPNGEFVYMNASCPADAGRYSFIVKTSTQKKVIIILCLLPMSFGESEKKLVPYKIDKKGKAWGADIYSTEVSDYKKNLEKRFKIPFKDEDKINKKSSRKYQEAMIDKLGYLIAGLAILGGIVFAIGWIVRGFLGIPHGMDKRPDA
jgi:hypothetical protein